MQHNDHAPLFGLYGEKSQTPEPGYVHIEDVAARSRALDWRIDSHRHAHLFQVLCIFDGSSEIAFDDHVSLLRNGSVITVPQGVVHAFRFTPGTQGSVLTVSDELLSAHADLSHLELLKRTPRIVHFECDGTQFGQLRHLLDSITDEFELARTGDSLMLISLVRIVLTILVRRLEETQLEAGASESDSEMLKGFRRLLEQHYATQWPVAQYAAHLNTSVSSLNRRCKRYVGLTAKAIIQNRVLLEAKRRLLYTREPVESVAWSLGFSDPAYFSRFFRRLEGLPPGEYRRAASNTSRTA